MPTQQSDKIDILVYYFLWYVLEPAIFVGFIISVAWPGARITVSDILMRGTFMFLALAVVYFSAKHYQNKGQ